MGSAVVSVPMLYLQQVPSKFASLFTSSALQAVMDGPIQLAKIRYRYKIIVGRSTSVSGPFLDQSGKDMKTGGGTTIMGSSGNVYAPGGQGVVTAADGTDILYYHYCKLTSLNHLLDLVNWLWQWTSL